MIFKLLYLKKFSQNDLAKNVFLNNELIVQCLLRAVHYRKHFIYITSLFPLNNLVR